MATTTTLANLEAEWAEAVAARNAHDERVRRIIAGIDPRCTAGLAQVRRSEGARRANLTRRIIRAEQAIDALRG